MEMETWRDSARGGANRLENGIDGSHCTVQVIPGPRRPGNASARFQSADLTLGRLFIGFSSTSLKMLWREGPNCSIRRRLRGAATTLPALQIQSQNAKRIGAMILS